MYILYILHYINRNMGFTLVESQFSELVSVYGRFQFFHNEPFTDL